MPASNRWSINRIATDLALIAVAVPLGLGMISPRPRGGCGMDAEFYGSSLGLTYFGVRGSWIVLKWLNDYIERQLAAYHSAKPPSTFREL